MVSKAVQHKVKHLRALFKGSAKVNRLIHIGALSLE